MKIIKIDHEITPESFTKTAVNIMKRYMMNHGTKFSHIGELEKMIAIELEQFYWAGRKVETEHEEKSN